MYIKINKTKFAFKAFALILIMFLFLPLNSVAHSGRTDSQGGHHDRQNGGYHYHHGHPAHDHPNGKCPYEIENENKSSPRLEKSNKRSLWKIILITIAFSLFLMWFFGYVLYIILSVFILEKLKIPEKAKSIISKILLGVIILACIIISCYAAIYE